MSIDGWKTIAIVFIWKIYDHKSVYIKEFGQHTPIEHSPTGLC